CGCAALSGGTDRTEDDSRHGKVHVRRIINDDGVIAAELEKALAHPSRHALAHLTAYGRGPGEGYECDPAIIDEARREVVARVDEQLEDWRQARRLCHA